MNCPLCNTKEVSVEELSNPYAFPFEIDPYDDFADNGGYWYLTDDAKIRIAQELLKKYQITRREEK